MTDLSLGAALLIGFLGSSHCLAMCGGLSSALTATGSAGQLGQLLSYNFGRIVTYALIGALVGLIGEQLIYSIPQLGMVLRILAGLLLIAMGLYVTQWWMGLTKLEKGGAYLWRYIQPLIKILLPVDSYLKVFLLGAVWGLLPCGLVYSTLSYALATASWQQSSLFMLVFGLGTLPAMLSTGFINQKFFSGLRKRNFRVLAGLFIIVMGLVTVFSPLRHFLNAVDHAGHSDRTSHQNHSAQ